MDSTEEARLNVVIGALV